MPLKRGLLFQTKALLWHFSVHGGVIIGGMKLSKKTVTNAKPFIIGTKQVESSVAGENVIYDTPESWTYDKYHFYKFQILVYEDCHISINNGDYFFMKKNRGFSTDERDDRISDVRILEDGITYEWIGYTGK